METFIPNLKLSTNGDFVQHHISSHILLTSETGDIIIRQTVQKLF